MQIVKVLVSGLPNDGYDYAVLSPAKVGDFVTVNFRGRKEIGIIIGPGDSGLPIEKIKTATIAPYYLSPVTIDWLHRMADWTMISPGLVLRLIANVPDAFAPPKTEQLWGLPPEALAKGGGGRMSAPRQMVADAFSSNDNEPMSANDIQNIARVSPAVINTMIKKEILIPSGTSIIHHPSSIIHYTDTKKIKLNAEQQRAADEIETDNFQVFLLDGITGSGKTQVYFDAAMRTYANGKSVLLMMPEIALTAQFMSRFADRFGAPPVVWHSNLTAARRREIWRGVARGEIRMVVGTRSALFLPWQNLGLIVVDEEHDGSYKQEEQGVYHARDMAILRAAIEKFPVILASATPSLETMKNVLEGKYKILKLTSRFGGATMPTIETIDMRQETRDKRQETSYLSKTLCDEIFETLNKKQQVMLFINRRGFAPIVQCKKCGWVAQCPDCSVGMTLHKRTGKLLCHVCGRTTPMPTQCPDCGDVISTRGAGLEKIEEEVRVKFPNARTALVSSDTMMTRQALERLVTKMENGEIDIVIGTQILAKGHHFPNLTLVGVVDADMGLFGADFRASENTFAQLFQVAGRAGRGEIAGRVLLQTYQPEHPVIRAICAGDRDTFITGDMENRRNAGAPPYGQYIAIIIEGKSEKTLQDFCKKLSAVAPKLVSDASCFSHFASRIMGPIPAPMYQIRNWYRMRFLVMGAANAKLQPAVARWLDKVKLPANVRVKVDVNPLNFI